MHVQSQFVKYYLNLIYNFDTVRLALYHLVHTLCLSLFEGKIYKQFRGLAQLVERAVWDREAGGSSPLSPTNNFVVRPDCASHCKQNKSSIPDTVLYSFSLLTGFQKSRYT